MAIDKITTASITDANITTAKLAYDAIPFRNIIINGDMSIAQRSTSASSITSGGYHACDRWKEDMTSAGTWTISQSTTVPTGQGFATSLKMDCTTANGSLSANSELMVQQRLEGQMLQYLKKGTSDAVSTTLSFWVRSNKTGTYICELQDVDNTRQISKSYTISSADTWEKKTITFPGDTTGALDNNNARSLDCSFYLAAGSDLSSGTLSTTWTAKTDANRAVGQVNLADSTSNEWYITGVQLEAGTSASDFEFLPVDVNLERCQRYCYAFIASASNNTAMVFSGASRASTNKYFYIPFQTSMRSVPSITTVGETRMVYAGGDQVSGTDTLTIGGVTPSIAAYDNNRIKGVGLFYATSVSGMQETDNAIYNLMFANFGSNRNLIFDSEL